MDDPYQVLGVSRDCDAETLKSAYRRLVRLHHPDVTPDKVAATLRMTQINAAWSLVCDPQKREEFDLRLRFEERRKREAQAALNTRVSSPSANSASSKVSSQSPSPPRRQTVADSQSAGRSTQPKSVPVSPKKSSVPAPSAPTSRHARLAEASRLLFKQNQPEGALEICRAILKTDFRNIPARELMGEAYLRLGQPERALAVWEQALVLSPNNAPLRRRYMSLKSPDTPPQPMPAGRAAPSPINRQNSARARKSNPGLLSRLIGRLKGR